MGIRDDIEADYFASLAALAWQVDLGADQALGEHPASAYDLPEKPAFSLKPAAAALPAAEAAAVVGAPMVVAFKSTPDAAQALAKDCNDLAQLDSAAAQFEGCELRKGARGAVAGQGHPNADVLVLCDPPSTEAERIARIFTPSDQGFFDKMFAAIGLDLNGVNPASALHLAPVLPWPMRSTDQMQADALRMMRPFLLRRIELVQPKLVVVMGHFALSAVLKMTGLQQARGAVHRVAGLETAAIAMHAPHVIMKSPIAKRDAWADLLAMKSALRGH